MKNDKWKTQYQKQHHGGIKMRPVTTLISRMVIASAFVLAAITVQAQSWRPPADAERCPSKWGPTDQRGSANHMKPETVLRATKLIHTGEVIEMDMFSTPRCPSSERDDSTCTPNALS